MARLVPLFCWLLLLAALFCTPALAHKASDSYLTLRVDGHHVEGQWDIALRDLDHALSLDSNGDGSLTWGEIRQQQAAIAEYALARLQLAHGDAHCPLHAEAPLIDRHTDGAYAVLMLRASCAAPVQQLRIGYRLFAELDPLHKGLVHIKSPGGLHTTILGPDKPQDMFDLATGSAAGQGFVAYLWHGIWHILIGADHILFLLSLLLPAGLLLHAPPLKGAGSGMAAALAEVFKLVTAFTLAHSITLSMASLHLVTLPSLWVETAIAASVVLAALNNLVRFLPARRSWIPAFAFGLIHGFGFAGVLAGLGLPRDALVSSLFAFNLGVELGQLGIVAACLPLALLVRSRLPYRRVVAGASMLIALIGATWMLERLLDFKLLPV
jgi:hypothetical protein